MEHTDAPHLSTLGAVFWKTSLVLFKELIIDVGPAYNTQDSLNQQFFDYPTSPSKALHLVLSIAMLFTKYIAALALPLLAVATTTVTITPAPTPTPISPDQCNTGSLECCNSVQSASSSPVSTLLGLLGIVLQGVDLPIGLTCSPLSILGIGGNSCSANPVCCQNNSFSGLIALGCIPVNINL